MQTSYSPEFIATPPLSRSYTMFPLTSVSSSRLDSDESIFMDSITANSCSICSSSSDSTGSSSSSSTGSSSSDSTGSSSSSSTASSSSDSTVSSSSSSTGSSSSSSTDSSSISSGSSSVTSSKFSSSTSASSSSSTSTTLRDVNEYTPTPAFSIRASSSTREDPEILIEYLEQALAQDHISRRKRRKTGSSNVHNERFRAFFINLATESSSSPDNKDFSMGKQLSNSRRIRNKNLSLKKMLLKKRRYSDI